MPPSNAPEASVPKSSVTKPIVLLAFANDRNDRARYLRNLPEERRRVRAALEPALAAGLCDVVELAGATVGDLLDAFQDPAHRGRIALFHFGGHAGSAELLFESAEGTPAAAHAGGLASFLGAVEGLELVFLNGCSSDGQVEGLLGAGVSAVVATSQAIDDRLATELSARFYGALGAGTTLTAAFEEAKAAVRTHVGDRPDDAYRSFLPETAAVERPWPWDLHLAEGAAERAAQWSLGAAAGDPLYGLPPVADEGLPEAPYPLLTPYTAADAPIFFGRGAEIRRLHDRLTHPDAETLQLVYGAGGVGKSSLLAAGLAPRLRATRDVVYVRREAHRALAETFAEALGDGPLDGERQGGEASTFGERWRAREARSGRPLVVIVDQAEEGWNRPGPRELRAVGGALQELAATPPRGQLVLGFRSEWLAECLHLLDLLGIPRGAFELRALDRGAIREVVLGPTSRPTLRRRYGLTVDSSLPGLVADDLLDDRDAALAPALQILLSKMWHQALATNPAAPHFGTDLYRRSKREGTLLDDFLQERLDDLTDWDSELVGSGLPLDLLVHLTGGLGTAVTRDAADVLRRYGPRPGLVELIGRCQRSFLVTGTAQVQDGRFVPRFDPGDGSPPQLGTLRLAHDTFAPLVRRRFETSDLPGQRALRILLRRAPAEGAEPVPLDDVDLATVEAGGRGMRRRTVAEERLVAASRLQSKRRRLQRRVLRAAAILAVLAIATAAVIADWQRRRADDERLRALDAARVSVAGEWMDENPTLAALALLEVEAPDQAPYAVAKMRRALDRGIAWAQLEAEGPVTDVAYSPSGDRVAVASADGTVRLHRADGTGRPHELPHDSPVRSLAYGPGGERLLTLTDDGPRVWRLGGGGAHVSTRLTGHDGPVRGAVFADGGRFVVSAGQDGTARIWSVATADPQDGDRGVDAERILGDHGGPVTAVAAGPDDRIATGALDGVVRIWRLDGPPAPAVFSAHGGAVSALAFAPGGGHLVSASHDGTGRIFDLITGTSRPLEGHQGPLVDVAVSPDGRLAATVSFDRSVRIWRLEAGAATGVDATALGEPPLAVLGDHDALPSAARFHPSGDHLAVATADGSAWLWRVDGRGEPRIFEGHAGGLRQVHFSPSGEHLATASEDHTARLWRVAATDPRILRGHRRPVTEVRFDPLGDKIVTAAEDGTARVFWLDPAETAEGRPPGRVPDRVNTLEGHTAPVSSAEFGPQGLRVVTAGQDGTARIFALDGTSKLLEGHAGPVIYAAFDPTGAWVVTTSADATARLWPQGGSGEPQVLAGHTDKVVDATFTHAGDRVVTASLDGTARIWGLDEGGRAGEPTVLAGHGGGVLDVAVDAAGIWVATASMDGTARVWSLGGDLLDVLEGHGHYVGSAAFDPFGERLVTGSMDGTARVWDLDPGAGAEVILEGHGSGIVRAAFDPTGQHVITASMDGTARIWPADGRGEPVVLTHDGPVGSAVYGPAGERIATASLDGAARVWTVDPWALQDHLAGATTLCLDPWHRVAALGELEAEAEDAWDRCERSFDRGPPRRRTQEVE